MAGININKTTGNRQYKWDNQDITEEMNDRVNALCKSLFTDSEFRKEAVFKDIQEYIHLYDRILYTPISNTEL